MPVLRSSARALIASGRVDEDKVLEGRAGAKTAPGHPYVIGFTPGGARLEVTAQRDAAGRWRYRYDVSGYAAGGSDLSLA